MDKDLRTTLTRHRKAERALHARLVREIELLVTPHNGPLLAVFFPKHTRMFLVDGERYYEASSMRTVRGGRTLCEILGFVEGGVADDVYVGLSTRGYETMLVDDLVALLPVARKLATQIRNDEFSGKRARRDSLSEGNEKS